MAAPAERSIGVVGLGLMGRPIAVNLLRAGMAPIIHNRSRGVVDELAAMGMRPAATPREVAESAGIVILVLPDTPTVETVVTQAEGVLAGLRPDSVVVDMGTTAVSATRALAARVAEKGGHWVDAPVSGGTLGAETATLTIMVGADDTAFRRVRPVLEALGRTITHVGAVGAGQVAKAANQVIVGLTIGAVSEALALAAAAGADPARVREALMGGFAASRILEVHGRRMIDRDFAPGGKAVTQRKDMAQALALAAELGLDLPATRLNRDLYDRLIGQGDGDLDHAALIRLYGWA